ncbi:MAG: hypothetical protein FWD39_04690 [Clostridiales bacterium]|nr:hypothetical protein [Clostridiales bacterium]
MKKSSFITMIAGTIGGLFFAIGMCMCLLPEWDAFAPGVVMGVIGAVTLLGTWLGWRKTAGKSPIRLSKRTAGITLFGIASALLLGVGMCFAMVWSNIVLGIIIGVVGIVMLLSLVPMVKGLH